MRLGCVIGAGRGGNAETDGKPCGSGGGTQYESAPRGFHTLRDEIGIFKYLGVHDSSLQPVGSFVNGGADTGIGGAAAEIA